MVEEQFGLASWQEILDTEKPASGGVYVGTAIYDDEGMMRLISSAAEVLDIPPPNLIRHYGKYLWGYFEEHYDSFITDHSMLRSFLFIPLFMWRLKNSTLIMCSLISSTMIKVLRN